jgi:hypothetical protein
MLLRPLYECDIVDLGTREVLVTVTLPLVPRVGEDLRLTGDGYAGKVYRVASVQYEIEHRQRAQLGHLSRVTICVESPV